IEALCKPKLVELMNQWKQENEWAVSIFESEANTNPFRFK
ncbi:Nif3-like dinuclear metal center hexameric protein, partial [Enterococcus faecalis]